MKNQSFNVSFQRKNSKKKYKAKKEKGYYLKRIPSYIMYIVSAILILIMISSAYGITKDATRQIEKSKGYGSEEMYQAFADKNYESLFEQIAFNQGIQKTVTEEEKDYYAFAECYNSAVNYRMYMNNQQMDKAQAEYDNFVTNEAKIKHMVFTDVLADVRVTYGLNEHE